MRVTMPKDQRGRIQIPLGTLYGGLWLDVPPEEIPPGGWTDGYDMVVTNNYKVAARRGRDLLVDLTAPALGLTMPTDKTVYGIAQFDLNSSTSPLYVFVGNKLFKYASSAWAEVTSGSLPYTLKAAYWSFCRMENASHKYLVCVSYDNPILLIDETGACSTPTLWSGGSLKPTMCCVDKGRLVVSGDVAWPTSVFFSVMGDPTLFTSTTPYSASDYQEFKVGGVDGQPVRAIVPKYGVIIVIKSNSIWRFDNSAWDPVLSSSNTGWTVNIVSSGVGGCIGCHRTLVDLDSDVLFMSENGNYQSIRDTERFGMLASSSVSGRQVRSYLAGYTYSTAHSIVDPYRGWALLIMKSPAASRNDGFVIYDYNKRGVMTRNMMEVSGLFSSPELAPWYRVAPIKRVISSVLKTVNARSCFGFISTYAATSDIPEVVSGGYNAQLFREFALDGQEDLDDAQPVHYITGWLKGMHITLDDYSLYRVDSISLIGKFTGSLTVSTLDIGVVEEPYQMNRTTVTRVPIEDVVGTAAIYGTAVYGTSVYGASPYIEREMPVVGVTCRTSALYVKLFRAPCELGRIFLSIEPKKV